MPRRVAFEILKKARRDNTYTNIAIDTALKKSDLTQSDRALCSIIVLGVTERRITLDYYIDKLANSPKDIDDEVRIILEISLYQMLYLDRIPPYAAVNEAVNMSKRKYAGFVNAILRNFMRKKDSIKFEGDEIDKMSLEYSYPRELCQKFSDIYGYERAKNILDIFNRAPKMTLRVNTLLTSKQEYRSLLKEKGIEARDSQYLDDALIIDGAEFGSLPFADEGYVFVQDQASQICVEAIGAKSGEFIIDTCSCPGSKSFGCAIKMQNNGKILSCDLHKSKLSLVDSGAKRLSIDIIETLERDGRSFDESLEKKADRVLCDVPCSGLGVIGKKPEIRYKNLSDIEKLPDIQLDILKNASRYVKDGGVLVYSTCTVVPEENELNIKRFLSDNTDFELLDFEVGGLKSSNGCLTLNPDEHNTDGFFVCKMKRIK